jgi:hypothetical protein
MELSPSSEAANCAAIQEIRSNLWNNKIPYPEPGINNINCSKIIQNNSDFKTL